MKSLIMLVLSLVLTTSVFAKGVGSVKVNENFKAKKQHITMALEIDEALIGPLAYHSYSALGDNKIGDGFTFLTSHQFDIAIKKVVLSPGVSLKYVSELKKADREAFIKVSYLLW